MKNLLMTFDEQTAYSLAEKYFIKTCGFNLEKAKHQKMLADGMGARSQGLSGIKIRAKVSAYTREAYQDHKVNIDGIELTCQAFEQIEAENIKRIYIYVLTAGEMTYSDDDPIMKQLYSDIWGTAYADAGRDLLEDELNKDIEKNFPGQLGKSAFLSDSFGPGFYGMVNTQTKELFKILDVSDMGVEVRESGIMLPLKTVAGVYFAVGSMEKMPHQDCAECIGNTTSCEYCRFRHGR